MPRRSRGCTPTAGAATTGAPTPTRTWTATWSPTAKRSGSLLDNLHVAHDHQRTGIGTVLMASAAQAVADRAASRSLYLWVLEQNAAAQRFYGAIGGTFVERSTVLAANGGNPARLHGSPHCLRIAWPDVSMLRGSPRDPLPGAPPRSQLRLPTYE